MEATFVAKVLKKSPKAQLPRTRWMMNEDPEAMCRGHVN